MPRLPAPGLGLRRIALGAARSLAWLACVSVVGGAAPARAADEAAETERVAYTQPLPSPVVAKTSPASRWAGLSAQQCLSEVARRKLGVTRFRGAAVGVQTPVRVTGPIAGVRFVTPGKKSPYGIMDCRLALALSDLAPLLKRYDVVEARVDNMYRPHAHLPGKKKPSQHSYGLAADVTRFKRADGSELVVERDFQGAIGEPVCGTEARARGELTSDAATLRDLICDVQWRDG